MLLGCDLNSRYTKDMTNNMEARMYAHTHIVLARVQYIENRPAHLVLYSREKQLKVRRMQGISPCVATVNTYRCRSRPSQVRAKRFVILLQLLEKCLWRCPACAALLCLLCICGCTARRSGPASHWKNPPGSVHAASSAADGRAAARRTSRAGGRPGAQAQVTAAPRLCWGVLKRPARRAMET